MISLEDLSDLEREIYEERSAIYEYDAGLSRREAEHKALADIEKKRRLI